MDSQKPKRKNLWIDAIRVWNNQKGGPWCVPRKPKEGEEASPDYKTVKAIMEELKGKPKTSNAVQIVTQPELPTMKIQELPSPTEPIKKGRGRPRKTVTEVTLQAKKPVGRPRKVQVQSTVEEVPKKGRGRPRKTLQSIASPVAKVPDTLINKTIKELKPKNLKLDTEMDKAIESIVVDALRAAKSEIAMETALQTNAIMKSEKAKRKSMKKMNFASILNEKIPILANPSDTKVVFEKGFKKALDMLMNLTEAFANGKFKDLEKRGIVKYDLEALGASKVVTLRFEGEKNPFTGSGRIFNLFSQSSERPITKAFIAMRFGTNPDPFLVELVYFPMNELQPVRVGQTYSTYGFTYPPDVNQDALEKLMTEYVIEQAIDDEAIYEEL